MFPGWVKDPIEACEGSAVITMRYTLPSGCRFDGNGPRVAGLSGVMVTPTVIVPGGVGMAPAATLTMTWASLLDRPAASDRPAVTEMAAEVGFGTMLPDANWRG